MIERPTDVPPRGKGLGMAPLRMIQFGLGAVGTEIVRLAHAKGLKVVGAVDNDPAKLGRDVGEIAEIGKLGVSVGRPDSLCRPRVADIMLHATRYDPAAITDDIVDFLRAGINVISTSGVSFLPGHCRELADRLDDAARAGGSTVIGTGLNPGFLQDVVPILMTSACESISKITSIRITDFSPWGPEVMRHYGIGLTPEEFESQINVGKIGLHEEIIHSMDMIAYALGGIAENFDQQRLSIVTSRKRTAPWITIDPGHVCGFRHLASARCSTGPELRLELIALVHPDPARDGVVPGTRVIIDGLPAVEATITGELNSARGVYAATAARAVNAIPYVLSAPPGLTSLADLPATAWWSGALRERES
jgi:2,4-diaminopentanoate dehydrogenase